MERFRDNFLSKPNVGMERFRDGGMERFHSTPQPNTPLHSRDIPSLGLGQDPNLGWIEPCSWCRPRHGRTFSRLGRPVIHLHEFSVACVVGSTSPTESESIASEQSKHNHWYASVQPTPTLQRKWLQYLILCRAQTVNLKNSSGTAPSYHA